MMGLIISLAILLVVTLAVAWSVRGMQITAPIVVVSIALAGAVGITGFWLDNYTTCHSRREGRDDVRAAFIGLYDTLEVTFPDPDVKVLIDDLRGELNVLLPPIECNGGLL